MHVIEACSLQELPPLDDQALDLLVVDVDRGVKSDWSLLSNLREQARFAALPIVALSWENITADKALFSSSLFSSLPFLSSHTHAPIALPNVSYLSKPFDARALHLTISKLLTERAAQAAAQLALAEAQVLASYEQHASPSIWPVVTAAGLFLLVVGLLLQFLVAIVGVVLILTSLLLWTLGTKPARSVSSPTVSTMSPTAAAN
jgi:CheY-like chemotaxis protein